MADDWDTVTKIGSKARGGASQRETVVRGKSALNAAQRNGNITSTVKKMGSGNAASRTGAEGQHLTKVDRSEVIVPLKQVGMSVGKAISTARQEMDPKLTQKDLATKLNVKLSDITAYEAGTAAPDNKLMSRMEIMLNVHLRGPKLSKPLRVSDEEKAKAEKAKAEKGKTKQSGK